MRVEYDRAVNAAYLYLKESTIAKSIALLPGIICDVDDRGELVGVEILNSKPINKVRQ